MNSSRSGLSEAQLSDYAESGYVLLPELFAPKVLARLSERFEAIVRGEVERGAKMTVMEDIEVVKGAVEPKTPVHGVNKILSFEDDPVLWTYATNPGLIAAVRSIVGPSLVTISTNFFNKPPGVDGRHPLHQDLRYFALRPADGIVGTWTAIGTTTRENGCLAVIPGSHKQGLAWHAEPDWEHVNSGFFAIEKIDLDTRVHLEMSPGDTLLFHPLLVHGSGRNRSRDFRRAISTHYASRNSERPDQPRKRPPVMREIP